MFGISNLDFLSAPGFLEITNLLGIFNGQPARTFNLSLENEELEHTLISSKEAFKGVSRQSRR
jgi:hypothetical protein